ncbi:MAG: histidine phosphatase family protein [Firmicutes bacterium]|nr:histidine phosphatase family protein [Bacillota bacterium]
MKLYFIRHGQTDWNLARKIQGTTDIPLNENGIAQAHNVGRMLLEKKDLYPIDCIFTSSLKRASKTAEIIASYLELPYAEAPGFYEVNLGKFEGKTWAESREEFPEEFEAWHANRHYTPAPGGGESYHDSYVRCAEGVRSLVARLPKDTRGIAIVSHGGTIYATIAAITNTDLDHMEKYTIGNLSVTIFDYTPETDTWVFESIDSSAADTNGTLPK